jgi:hypothetical protein
MHQRTCEIVERFLLRMLFRRCAHIESNVVVIIELRFIIDIHVKVAEKINSKWDCSFQSVWLQNVFTSQKNKCIQKKWKNKISNFHRIFNKVWFHQYLSNLKFKERRRKWLSRRHIQRNEIFRHVRNCRSFQERRKKFYVTYRAISLQIFENSDEKQYDRILIRKHVLNNSRKNVVSKSMMKKKISSSVEIF